MTQNQKIEYFRTISGEASLTDTVARAYLDMAENRILNKIFPFEHKDTLPAKYEHDQCLLALILYSKRGAEGESSHSENGITRQYEDEEHFLARFTPFAKVCL